MGIKSVCYTYNFLGLGARLGLSKSQAGPKARVGRVYGPGLARALRARQPGLSGFEPGLAKPLLLTHAATRKTGPVQVLRAGPGHEDRCADPGGRAGWENPAPR